MGEALNDAGGAIRMLHVDEEPDLTDLATAFLEHEHRQFEIETAESASDGLSRLSDAEFDCIVSDYDIPGQNGVEFLETVREEYPDLPFVLFTCEWSKDIASEAIAAGVTEYLPKSAGTKQYEHLADRIERAVDQDRIERELERRNNLFARAQAIANVGAWEYDIETESSYLTDQLRRIYDIEPDDELSFWGSLERYHPDDRERVRDAFDRAVDEGESYDLEVRLVAGDGTNRWVRTYGEPRFEDGRVVRVRGILQEITDRKRRQRKLERRNERLEEFAHVVSHDIRNPLQVAKGHLELAREGHSDESFRRVSEAHDRIEAIVEDILTLAKQGEEISTTRAVDIPTIAREAWKTVDTSRTTLRVTGSDAVKADPNRLRQLFENLFRNAVEHSSTGPRSQAHGNNAEHSSASSRTKSGDNVEHGSTGNRAEPGDAVEHTSDEVTITVGPIEPLATSTRAGTSVSRGFYVADDGPGIPEDERGTVFEAGYSTAEDGTGFGLSIVERIAEAHGWTIEVTESVDGGARFEITGVEFTTESDSSHG